jgi:uncharacterized protein YneF (UPF0154 family)
MSTWLIILIVVVSLIVGYLLGRNITLITLVWGLQRKNESMIMRGYNVDFISNDKITVKE